MHEIWYPTGMHEAGRPVDSSIFMDVFLIITHDYLVESVLLVYSSSIPMTLSTSSDYITSRDLRS